MRLYKRVLALCLAGTIASTSFEFKPAFAVDDNYIALAIGETQQLDITGDYCSADKSIAIIDNDNVVAINEGSTVIAYANDTGLHKIPVIVDSQHCGIFGEDAKGCTVDLSTENYQLQIQGSSDITFSTNTPDILSCTDEGIITSITVGEGNVVAKLQNTDTLYNIPITVVKKKLDYTLEEFVELSMLSTGYHLLPTLYEKNVSLTYLSNDTNIVTVSSEGILMPVSAGMTTITVTAKDGKGYAGFTETVFVHCTKKDYALDFKDFTLLEGESYVVDTGGVAADISVEGDALTLKGNTLTAIKPGVCKITVTLPDTAEYNEKVCSFNITVNPIKEYNILIDNGDFAGKAKYHEQATIEFDLESDTAGELPLNILCEDITVYSGMLPVKEGKHTYSVDTDLLTSVGKVTVVIYIDNQTFEFDANILPPDFQVTINDTPEYLKPGEFIQISYTVKATGDKKELHSPLQLMLDNKILATEQIDLTETVSSKTSIIGAYVPKDLVDGQHKLKLCVIINDSTYALYDETILNTINPNMGLLINNRALSTVDTYVYSSAHANISLQFTTANKHEQIKTVSMNGKTYSVLQNKTVIDLALAKSEEQDITIVVVSADGEQEKSYALTIIRANDDTNIIGEFEDTKGNVYYMNTDTLPYRLCLPSGVSSGALTVRVEDSSAKILTLNNKQINRTTGTCSIELPGSGELTIETLVQAGDVNVTIPYKIIITNNNYTPEVQIRNSSEITNRIYGSVGVLVGKELIPYGPDSTTVDAAIATGHTKGLIIDLAVSDYNYNQYLGGYITIDDTDFPIHWNSFDGPVKELAANISRGYIYVDNTAFSVDSNISLYTITIQDFTDEFVTESISKTTATVTFGVNVLADNFSTYFDEQACEIVVETTATNYMLSMRKSGDNGLTWTEPQGCGLRIPIKDPGTIMYEITLTDSMLNTTVKTITVTKPGSETILEDVSIYVSTSRHADYIYINTLKSNTNVLNINISDIFK